MIALRNIKRVYCIGLGGVGVSAVAKLFLARGAVVSGSDPNVTPIVNDVVRRGAIHYPAAAGAHITADIDLVVATDDAPADHPERLAAAARGIPVENFSVTLGRFMAEYPRRVTMAGTNGKSTTTAMTGMLLAAAGQDPTVFVGSRVSEFDGNLRIGRGHTIIAEADEFRDHFLNYQPTVAAITNVEPDHLDYFRTAERMLDSFRRYADLLGANGTLVVNADDAGAMTVADGRRSVVTFGIEQPADLIAVRVASRSGQQGWETRWHQRSLGMFTLPLPGRFNVMNALAAMATALTAGADPRTFAATLEKFHGIWRRFQILNPKSSITIVSDYAHHPTAVRVTIAGARAFYPGRRIIIVFQPHYPARLTALFDDFVKSFEAADETMIVEAYTVPGRAVPAGDLKTSQELVQALAKRNLTASYAASPPAAEEQVKRTLKPGDVVIIMGAGDIWRSADNLGRQYA